MPGGRDRPYHASLGVEGAKMIRWRYFSANFSPETFQAVCGAGGVVPWSLRRHLSFLLRLFFLTFCGTNFLFQEHTLHLPESCSSLELKCRWLCRLPELLLLNLKLLMKQTFLTLLTLFTLPQQLQGVNNWLKNLISDKVDEERPLALFLTTILTTILTTNLTTILTIILTTTLRTIFTSILTTRRRWQYWQC